MVTERTKKAGAGLAKAAGVAAGKGASKTGNTPPLARQTVGKRDESRLYIWGLVWLWLVAPFLLLCLIAPQWAGALGNGISLALRNCIGMAGWVMPMIAFLAASWCFNYNNKAGRINIKVVIPLLLLFSVFFAARCGQGGNIGKFIDGVVAGIIGEFGAWTLATLGFLSVFVFTWNLSTEETIEGCKALSQFSGSSLSELGHRALSGLSKFGGWLSSIGKHCAELLSNAKERLSEHHQEEDDDIELKAKEVEEAEPTELEQKAVFYEESGLMPTAKEDEKVEPLTSRGFFEDDSEKKELDRDKFEESLQAPRLAEPKPILLERERLDRAEKDELINEIHRRNTSGEMASVRNREYEAARKAEQVAEAKNMYATGSTIRRGAYSSFSSTSSWHSPANNPTNNDRVRTDWKRDDKKTPIAPSGNKEPLHRQDKTEIRSGVYAKHEPATAKEGLALSRRLAERPSHNSGSGFTRSSSSFSSRNRLGEKSVNEEKDLPLRPVRSSSSGGYKAARNAGGAFLRGAVSERKPNLVDSDETVEIASLKRTPEPKPNVGSDSNREHSSDELDKKVEALKFAERLDSDLNLLAPEASTNGGGARAQQAQPKAEEAAEPVAAAKDGENNSGATSARKMSELSPEERRRALGLIRRPADGARAQQAQPKAEEAAELVAAAKDGENNSGTTSARKMSELSPEERRRALGLIRRPAGGARAQQAQPKAEEAAEPVAAAKDGENNSGTTSARKMSELSPEERRRALGLIRRPAGGARAQQAQPKAEEVAEPAAAADIEPKEPGNESVSASALKKLNALSPEERRRALGLGEERRPSALPVDPEALESFSTLSPSQINALPPEERRRALGIRGAAASYLNRDRNSLSDIKALRGAEGQNVACDPKAALNALSSRRPGAAPNVPTTAGGAAKASARPAEPKAQASFTRSSTPSLMRSTASRSTAVSRTAPAKSQAEAQEMTKEAKLAAWRASTLRARASFKRQSEGKARLRQEKAIKEVSDDMPFANDLMNPQGPALRPPVAQNQAPSASASLASKRTARQQLGIIPRARKNGSTSRHGVAHTVNQADSSDGDDVDFRKKNAEIELNSPIEQVEAHSAIGSPEMLNRLVADNSPKAGVRPQLGEFSDASLNRQVKARLSQFHSAVGELQGVTWSEGGDLDSLLNPSKHSAAALAAVSKPEAEEKMALVTEPAVLEASAKEEAPSVAKRENIAQVEPITSTVVAAQPAPSVHDADESQVPTLAKAEEEEDLPFPKPRSSANHKAVSSSTPAVVAQLASPTSSEAVAVAKTVVKATNSVSRAEVAAYVSSERANELKKLEEAELADEKVVELAEQLDQQQDSEAQIEESAASEVDSLTVAANQEPEHHDAASAALAKAKSTVEVQIPSELLEAADAVATTEAEKQSTELEQSADSVEANVGAISPSPMAEPQAIKRFDLGLGNEGAAVDFDSIMPRDRDRFTNLRPINLTGSSVYRNPIRPSFFSASRIAAAPAMSAAVAQPAPVAPAAPAAPAMSAAVAQPAPAAPAMSAAVAQPAPVVPAAPAAPVMSAAVAQPRRSPAFGFDRGERRIIGSSTPVSGSVPSAQRPAALYPSSIPSVSSVRVVGQQQSNLSSAPLAMPRKSNSGALQAVEHYMLPSLALLEEVPPQSRHEFVDKSELLIRTLASFKVEATVRNVIQGPAVTRYELEPAIGVRVNKFINLTNDIALALAATTVRIEAPVPGKSVVGVEVPNGFTELVSLREVLSSDNFRNGKGLCVGLGKDISGTARVTDLSKMPHLLVAGTTGSGKSVCINTLILSLLYRFTPRNLQLLMIDPKQVELSIYEGLPHLICLTGEEPGKIIVDPKMASSALHQMVNLMEERYTMFSKNRVRNIGEYNVKHPEATLPWVVIIIDELADLMMVASKDVEKSICRLAQKARAAGIHMVVATQRPSTDVITGLLKVNIPSRIAFAVSSGVDSRVILDDGGAEHLLGKGDMLFKPVDANNGARIQGAFVKNEEIQRVVDFWNRQDVPSNRIQLNIQEDMAEDKADKGGGNDANDDDPLLEEALDAILRTRQASASMLQTELRVGYARARRLINLLEKRGYVGPAEGSKARKILYTGAMD